MMDTKQEMPFSEANVFPYFFRTLVEEPTKTYHTKISQINGRYEVSHKKGGQTDG